MKCKYCFYHDLAKNRQVRSYGKMEDDLLELIIKNAFFRTKKQINFSFQGGEPTLAGLKFYKKFLNYVKKYNKGNIKVNYALQTNGLIIDDQWAKFFKDHNFLIGLSIDGNKKIHNYYRINRNNEGTYKRVIKTAELFKNYKVNFNILTVITNQLARHIKKVYKNYKKQDFKYLQFIRCIEPKDQKDKNFGLKPKNYEIFLNRLFKQWYQDIQNGKYISIRHFDNLIRILMGLEPEACEMKGFCSMQNIIEADGKVYPCDFYCIKKWEIGNIKENSFLDLYKNKTTQKFINQSTIYPQKCKKCRWFQLYRNGCRRNHNRNDLNKYCSSFKNFFKKNIDQLIKLSKIFSNKSKLDLK